MCVICIINMRVIFSDSDKSYSYFFWAKFATHLLIRNAHLWTANYNHTICITAPMCKSIDLIYFFCLFHLQNRLALKLVYSWMMRVSLQCTCLPCGSGFWVIDMWPKWLWVFPGNFLYRGMYADMSMCVCVLLGSLVTVIWCSVMPTQNITDPISLSSM